MNSLSSVSSVQVKRLQHDVRRERHGRGGGSVSRVQSLPQTHLQSHGQRGSAPPQDARQVHLQLGGDGASEGHAAPGAVLLAAHLQEHHGLHPLRGRGGEPERRQTLAGQAGGQEHQAERLHGRAEDPRRRAQNTLPHPARLGLLLPGRQGHERDASRRAAGHHSSGGAAVQVVLAQGTVHAHAPPLGIFSMSLLINTPDSDNSTKDIK